MIKEKTFPKRRIRYSIIYKPCDLEEFELVYKYINIINLDLSDYNMSLMTDD